jgi:hypothetical protein
MPIFGRELDQYPRLLHSNRRAVGQETPENSKMLASVGLPHLPARQHRSVTSAQPSRRFFMPVCNGYGTNPEYTRLQYVHRYKFRLTPNSDYMAAADEAAHENLSCWDLQPWVHVSSRLQAPSPTIIQVDSNNLRDQQIAYSVRAVIIGVFKCISQIKNRGDPDAVL